MNKEQFLYLCRNHLPLLQSIYYIAASILSIAIIVTALTGNLSTILTGKPSSVVDNGSSVYTTFTISCPGAYLPENITEAVSQGICTYHRDTNVRLNQEIHVGLNVGVTKIPANISTNTSR